MDLREKTVWKIEQVGEEGNSSLYTREGKRETESHQVRILPQSVVRAEE